MGARTAFPGASKFKKFILLLQLVFELKLFEPLIGISILWIGNTFHVTGLHKIVPYMYPN